MDWTPEWAPKPVIYSPVNFEVAMYRIVPEVVISGRFTITLVREGDKKTIPTITYEQTTLGENGDKIVNKFTNESFARFMDELTLAIDHYLTTGEMIVGNELMRQEAVIHH
jgi:hypothetical protein